MLKFSEVRAALVRAGGRPGMLKVDFSTKGLLIRATGALALFVLSFVLTPQVF